jgi:protein phosphatase PTC2/3
MALNTILAAEEDRIVAAGGYIEEGRVFSSKCQSSLSPSRALGDFGFKKSESSAPEHQIITANPEVAIRNITNEDEFLVLASDGMFRSITS